MTASLRETTPLGVWDTCEPFYHEHHAEASAWAGKHIPERDRTYRAEFYLIDAPFAVLYRYRYRENAEGCFYVDPATGITAVDEPVICPLDELPPLHLLSECD